MTGVRAAESTRRAAQAAQAKIFGKEVALIHNMDNDESRRQIEQCYRTQKTLINPIIDCTDEDVWEFSKVENIKQNPLYIQCGGTKRRLGCVLCPMARFEDKLNDIKDYPRIAESYIKAFDRMIAAMPNKPKWQSGEEVFDWWVYHIDDAKTDENQLSIDDIE